MLRSRLFRFLPVLLVCPMISHGQNAFTLAEESQTWTSGVGDGSTFVRAKATSGANRPVVMSGNFNTQVIFPGLTIVTLSGTADVNSVFAGVMEYDGAEWGVPVLPFQVDMLEPKSSLTTVTPSAATRDLAVVSQTEYYLTGIVDEGDAFENRDGTRFDLSSTPPLADRGFLARGNNGTFDAAYHTNPDMLPRAASTDVGGSFLVIAGQKRDAPVSGGDALLHRYALPLPAVGAPLPAHTEFSDPELDGLDVADVAVTTSGNIWIGGDKPERVGVSDLWIGRADFAREEIGTILRAGSEGDDRLTKMERGPSGELLVAFSVTGREVSFGSEKFDLDTDSTPAASTSSTHAFLAMIKSDHSPAWMVPLAISRGRGSKMIAEDLAVDAAGNTIVTVSGLGFYSIEGVNRSFGPGGQIVVNGQGRVVDFVSTPSVDVPRTGAVPTFENRLVLGANDAGFASFASVEREKALQTSHHVAWADPGEPGNTIENLSALVTGIGGQVHLEANYPDQGQVAVSVWLTRPQLLSLLDNSELVIQGDPLAVDVDAGTVGENPSPAWALARIFDPYQGKVEGNDGSFFYPDGFVLPGDPETSRVRVYVIDRGLEEDEVFNLETFEGCPGNPLPLEYRGDQNLPITVLVKDTEDADYVPNSDSNHPRELINMVASIPWGSAAGSAMEVIGVDIYTGADPESGLTYLSYLWAGIYASLDDLENYPGVPGVFLIASSGESVGGELSLDTLIDTVLDEGIPIILSAGNDGNLDEPGQVADYVPAKHGVLDGVITVGATRLGNVQEGSLDQLNPIATQTNHNSGGIISLYAPGEEVSTGFGIAGGTSYSAALVAGLAATHLARNPEATPADVEEALVLMSAKHNYPSEKTQVNLARSVCSYDAWLYQQNLGELVGQSGPLTADDFDEDGLTNFYEFLAGSDPLDDASRGPWQVEIEHNEGGIRFLTDLPVSFVNSDGELHDGCFEGELFSSENLEDWQAYDFELTLGAVKSGRQEVSINATLQEAHSEKCFFRLEFSAP